MSLKRSDQFLTDLDRRSPLHTAVDAYLTRLSVKHTHETGEIAGADFDILQAAITTLKALERVLRYEYAAPEGYPDADERTDAQTLNNRWFLKADMQNALANLQSPKHVTVPQEDTLKSTFDVPNIITRVTESGTRLLAALTYELNKKSIDLLGLGSVPGVSGEQARHAALAELLGKLQPEKRTAIETRF